MMATEPGRLPDFVIIGAKRSGTTSLTRYLGAHPDVFMARPKEPHFFDLHYDRGLDWYRGLFADAIDAEPERIASGGRGAQVGYLDIGRYLPQLLAVREVYPTEALLILMFEEFMREPADGYRQLCRFIGVADTILPPNLGQRV